MKEPFPALELIVKEYSSPEWAVEPNPNYGGRSPACMVLIYGDQWAEELLWRIRLGAFS